jgi:hypothetical protein
VPSEFALVWATCPQLTPASSPGATRLGALHRPGQHCPAERDASTAPVVHVVNEACAQHDRGRLLASAESLSYQKLQIAGGFAERILPRRTRLCRLLKRARAGMLR